MIQVPNCYRTDDGKTTPEKQTKTKNTSFTGKNQLFYQPPQVRKIEHVA